MAKQLIVKCTDIRYSGESIGKELEFKFQIEEAVTVFRKQLQLPEQGFVSKSIGKVLFTKDVSSIATLELPIHATITEYDMDREHDDSGSNSSIFSINVGNGANQTCSFQVDVIAQTGSDKEKHAIFTLDFEAEIAEATISVSVVSSYEADEGIAHELTISSLFDERTEEYSVTSFDAAKQEYGLHEPFSEGEYQIRVSPFPIEGEEIGPKALGNAFQSTLYVKKGKANIVEMKVTRKQSLLHNIPVVFYIVADAHADGSKPLYEFAPMSTVAKYKDIIESEALEQGVDANLIRAIMYMETTHGYYDKLMELFDKNNSILPMNVRSDYWRDLGFSRTSLKKPETNIQAGTLLLKRITKRVQPVNIESIASVYNDLGTTSVTDYGARVKSIYEAKFWIPPQSFFDKIGDEFWKFEQRNSMEQYQLLKKMFGM